VRTIHRPETPAWVIRDLDGLDATQSRRRLTVIDSAPGARIRVEGRELLNFSSNDYLGFADHPALKKAAAEAALRWGAGSTASRLITGTLGIHGELEQRLAALKESESAILFSTGYQANQGILQALMPEGVILSDALNHASIVDGCRLSRAQTLIYRHGDAAHAAELLRAHKDASRKLLITDGLFSMDGDVAPLAALAEVARAEGALLVVDDAHATGVLGGGRGSAHHAGVGDGVHVHMGTLGKALGSFGAFAAASEPIRDLLVNRARALIYTTAPPPSAAGAALAALDLLEARPSPVERLSRLSARLREALRAAGFAVPDAPTPIVPLILGENGRTLAWAAALWREGFWVHPIRPPTVAPGESRLRITVTAAHEEEEIDRLVAALAGLAEKEPEGVPA